MEGGRGNNAVNGAKLNRACEDAIFSELCRTMLDWDALHSLTCTQPMSPVVPMSAPLQHTFLSVRR